MKAKYLHFKKSAPLPGTSCNYCGGSETQSSWHVADIPVHGGKDTASIVVCSKRCKKLFVQNPKADRYVNDLIKTVESQPRPVASKEIMAEFGEFLAEALKGTGITFEQFKAANPNGTNP